MSSPKHLWSGDWQDESDALARELAMRRAQTPAPAEPAAPDEKPVPAPPPTPIPPTVKAIPRPPRERRPGADPLRPLRQQWDRLRRRWHPPHLTRPRVAKPPWLRTALLVALALLIVAGGAYGLARAVGSGGSPKASANAGTPWLGVELDSLPVNRVVITAVVPGGPADASGLGPGDVIVSVNNRQVNAPGDVTAAIARMRPGDRVAVQIERGGLPLDAQVTLAARPAGYP